MTRTKINDRLRRIEGTTTATQAQINNAMFTDRAWRQLSNSQIALGEGERASLLVDFHPQRLGDLIGVLGIDRGIASLRLEPV